MDENNTQQNNKDMKVLRTYSSDMAEAVRTNEVSVIKIALAEKEKREQEALYRKSEGSSFSKIFFVIGGIIFILAAIVGSYFLIQKKKEQMIPEPTINNIESFISYDSKILIDTTNIKDVNELSDVVKKESVGTGLMQALFFTEKTDTSTNTITTKDFFSLIKANTPETLIRSLSDEYLFAKYVEEDENGYVLIFQTKDYSTAYASMLAWEKTLLKDLYILFDLNINIENNSIFEKQWKDVVINNKDARVLYGENGEELLYYVFVNKNHFIITNNIEAMKESVTRLLIKDAKPK